MALSNSKITNLPLRPTTTAMLLRRGFHVTSEIQLSKQSGGIANFAAELGCSLSVAASIFREVEQAKSLLENGTTRIENPSLNKLDNITNQVVNPSQSEKKTHGSQNIYEFNNTSGISAADLLRLQRKKSTRPIVTFCQSIDTLLGGGFATSEVTEVVGVPGVGKTQLAIQLCVDASIPKPHGGVEGESVYIDSEGSFAPERCYDMAQSLVEHIRSSAKRRIARYQQGRNNHNDGNQSMTQEIPESYTSESILSGIHVFRVYDEAAQVATIKSLYQFLSKRKNVGKPVKIVIIDSIAFHYRSTSTKTNYMDRTQSLATIASILSDVATKFEVAVVVTNHMTTKIEKYGSASNSSSNSNTIQSKMDITAENGSKLTPALGESWAHATTTRIILTHEKNSFRPNSSSSVTRRRRFTLVKSPHKPAGVAFYCVLNVGIRDCLDSNSSISQSQQSSENDNIISRGQHSPSRYNQYKQSFKRSRLSN